MAGVISGTVLVVVFAAVTALCARVVVRLYRSGARPEPPSPGDTS